MNEWNRFTVFLNTIKLLAERHNCKLHDADPVSGIVVVKGSKKDKRECLEDIINSFNHMSDGLFTTICNLVAEINDCKIVRIDFKDHWIEFDGTEEDQEACSKDLERLLGKFTDRTKMS